MVIEEEEAEAVEVEIEVEEVEIVEAEAGVEQEDLQEEDLESLFNLIESQVFILRKVDPKILWSLKTLFLEKVSITKNVLVLKSMEKKFNTEFGILLDQKLQLL